MICINSIQAFPKNLSLKIGEWYHGAYAVVCPECATCSCVQWYSDNPSVATVNPSSGYIYACSAGTAGIHAVAMDGSGCSDSISVTVNNSISVASVVLNPSSVTLELGECISLGATVLPENATNKKLTWTSSKPNVATVNNGTVCARAVGSAVITASAADGSGKSASCTVKVTKDVLCTSVQIHTDFAIMTEGDSRLFTASVCPENATCKSITWNSDNTSVATVNPSSGLVVAQGTGMVGIYVSADDGSGVIDSCSVWVVPAQKMMSVGDTINLESPAGTGGVSAVIWESSNPCVASVNSAGIVAAHREGTATLTAAADTERGFCTLNVVERGFVTVISCISNDWQDSSGTMGNSMSSAMGTDNSAVVVTPVNSTAFADCWNNAGHCLVIHTHGTPSELSGEEKINNVKIQNKIISVEEIRALEQNEHIDFIMMTSCSTAGGNPDENVACELSKKINPCGIVIANKRNVSGADKDFYASGEVPGWVAYRNGTVITEDLPVELNMEDAYEIFKNLT